MTVSLNWLSKKTMASQLLDGGPRFRRRECRRGSEEVNPGLTQLTQSHRTETRFLKFSIPPASLASSLILMINLMGLVLPVFCRACR